MSTEINILEKVLFSPLQLKTTAIEHDPEAAEYWGYNIALSGANIKFRKAKITPKKLGMFVTLWRRNMNRQTEPFHLADNVDYYIILTETDEYQGLFIFPKAALAQHQILTTATKEGKRGFRIYPPQVEVNNPQARKTQAWQAPYFVDLSDTSDSAMERIKRLLSIT
ncbi:MepB family protein [Sphingobacterium psychroaquaticum]|uniref:Uncharacterized protein n=1 Tax=Sphingobacterium psychroaquaticum TaxID=561061 RepID=A0A1X7I5S3_9SPHI|nr:MepB family protein [Sphingobacterium psychroaquaticum]QBQ41892.1 hypothetical protein E2P86_12295 [Sphingobacterium psychroaquaticum]SMG09842.1 hypothetical protein SAMN05660862_0490 [Sphingobacterium psychroaquaticum]